MKKKLIEGPFGLKTTEELARNLEAILKTIPREYRQLKRKSSTPTTIDLIEGERADISLITTESIDRQGEVVIAKGCDFTHYQSNPIVCFNHKYDEPIGKCLWIKYVQGGISAKTQYANRPKDYQGNWVPDTVWALTQQGILKGKSIGFLPTKIRSPLKDESQFKDANCVIESCLILEYSAVSVPCNQDAIVQAVSKGILNESTLKQLGLYVSPQKSTQDKLEIALKGVRLDPQKIASKVLKNLMERGKV